MSLDKSLQVSFAGLNAQSTRLRVIAENLANAESAPQVPGGEPYRRKVITFKSVLDKTIGANVVIPPPTRRATCSCPTSIRSSR